MRKNFILFFFEKKIFKQCFEQIFVPPYSAITITITTTTEFWVINVCGGIDLILLTHP